MAERSNDETLLAISRKLSVLIALSLRQLPADKEIGSKRKQGVADQVHYLADMGLDAKDIAEIVGSPLTSVRTLLTPTRRK
ncbi:MAG: hypothetical protein WDN03_02120 [Rhizomicrobium sp.]